MTQTEIQQFFQQKYDRSAWVRFLGQTFSNASLLSKPEYLTGINTDVATHVFKLGFISLNEDGVERQIAVYEVTLAKGIILERNRVGLRNLLRKYWKNIDAAFISFYNPESSNWRFTYVSELTGFDAEGEFVSIKTEPKRYTYILGEGETCRTAAERFALLVSKANISGLDDIKDAFSVEKLSKAFFDEYKNQYEDFVEFFTGKRIIKIDGDWQEKQIRQPSPQLAFIFHGSDKAARDFCKKMLGRIVFLYFIQKKGWLGVPVRSQWGEGNKNFISDLFDKCPHKETFYSEVLTKLFFAALNKERDGDLIELISGITYRIPFLNGGLFEEENQTYRKLIFPAQLFRNLFTFFNQYNFTIYEDDPNDHTIAVDPEMLGHIFENLLEDNKDKGAYYTPKEIVHYMCQVSLIEYLTTWFEKRGYQITGYVGFNKPDQYQIFSVNEARQGQMLLEYPYKTSKKTIPRILVENLLKKNLEDKDKKELLLFYDEFQEALDTVKICDPAIGSGAFPMGLLHEIFNAKQFLYSFKFGSLEGFDAAIVKLNIIQNSIYGVDIERGAVDIARLRFWLSLIVDEPKPKLLPNLDFKIVAGDSLLSKLENNIININWDLKDTSHGLYGQELKIKISNLLNSIIMKQEEYFNPLCDKKTNAEEIRMLKIDLIINQLGLMIKLINQDAPPVITNFKDKNKYIQATESYLHAQELRKQITKLHILKSKPNERLNFFDWKLDFPEIMNEYVVLDKGFDIVIANPPYVDIKNLQPEIVKVLCKSYITTENRINLYSIFLERSWQLLKSNGVLTYIIPNSLLMNSSYQKIRKLLVSSLNKIIKLPDDIFEHAIVETIILQGIKNNSSDVVLGAYYRNDEKIDFNNLEFKLFEKKKWNDDAHNRFNIFSSPDIEKVIVKIDNLKSIPLSELFDFSLGITPYDKYKGHTPEQIKNRIFHSQVKIDGTYVPLISGSNILKYIVTNNVTEYLKYGVWLGAPRQKRFFTEPRVIVRQIVSGNPLQIYAGYTEDELYHTQIGFSILKKQKSFINEKVLCALLNSRLFNFYHKFKYTDPEKNTFQKILIENCRTFPIPLTLNEVLTSRIDKLATEVINLKKQNLETDSIERQLDNLIFEAYSISIPEISVIAPDLHMKVGEFEIG